MPTYRGTIQPVLPAVGPRPMKPGRTTTTGAVISCRTREGLVAVQPADLRRVWSLAYRKKAMQWHMRGDNTDDPPLGGVRA